MRKTIMHIRSLFCKHDYLIEEGQVKFEDEFRRKTGTKVSMICKKCGYNFNFWKY